MKNNITLPPIIAHRGASGSAPENTFAAIKEAAKQGATWIEIDVAVTKDGIPVILHDDKLHRTTPAQGLLLKSNWCDIKDLDAGSWYNTKFKDERIPTLEATLELCHKLNLGINLEMKPVPGWEWQTTMATLDIIGSSPKVPLLISSFNTHCLHIFKDQAPQLPRALNVDIIPTDWHQCLAKLEATSLHFCLPYFDETQVKAVKESGYQLACFTVNAEEDAKRLLNAGVNAIFTDHPKMILEKIDPNQHKATV